LRLCTALSDCLLTPFERAKAKQYKTAQVTLFFPNSKHDYDRRDFHSHLPRRIGEQLHEPIKQARENTDGKENQEWLVIGGKTTKFAPIG